MNSGVYVPIREFFYESNETGHYGIQSTCGEKAKVEKKEERLEGKRKKNFKQVRGQLKLGERWYEK